MNYNVISKDTVNALYTTYSTLHKTELDKRLLALAELRVSQINGCAYCCLMHTDAARKVGIEQNVLDKLPGWRLSSVFNDKEKLILEWSESLTLLKSDSDKIKIKLESVLTEKELVDLTLAISIVNAFNRLAIAIGDEH